MNTTALSIVLNHHNSELIDYYNEHQKAKKIIHSQVINPFNDYLADVYYIINNKEEVECWRRLYNLRPNESVKKQIQHYEMLYKKISNQKMYERLLQDKTLQSTQLVQLFNITGSMYYISQLIDKYLCDSKKKRKTTCCGKCLVTNEHHTHYSYYSMLEDKQSEIDKMSCAKCRPAWRPDDEIIYPEKKNRCRKPLYNCLICEMKFKLFERYILFMNSTNYDNTQDNSKCNINVNIFDDYTTEELKTAGLYDLSSGSSYYEILSAGQNDEQMNTECLFSPFLPESDDEGDDKYENETEEEERKRCDEEDAERDRLMSLDKNDVSIKY